MEVPYKESGEGWSLTPCPNGMRCGPDKRIVVGVNSVVCRYCKHFVKNDPETKTVTCNFKESENGKKMKKYYVQWFIEVEAENPTEAAKEALEIQRDLGSTTVAFKVIDTCTGKVTEIELVEEKSIFDINNIFLYEITAPENVARTRKRLQEIKEVGMSYFNGEFFIKGAVSGLYIERVWDMRDSEFVSYMQWVKEVIKEKTEK